FQILPCPFRRRTTDGVIPSRPPPDSVGRDTHADIQAVGVTLANAIQESFRNQLCYAEFPYQKVKIGRRRRVTRPDRDDAERAGE
ncbi:MAG TPA: hypothetical protein VME40_15170, partial [Caulobacteraceae bacterium]|nr:hypothetical protein [Caulobacteraceae bacterium]